MSRKFTVKAKALPDDHIFGLREVAATGRHGAIEITYDHGFGFGKAVLFITVRYPDGRLIQESIGLTNLFSDWGLAIINENKPDIGEKED
jgi:hypothetical protein